MRNVLLTGLLLGLFLIPTACNYRFGGYREGYKEINTLYIPPF